MDNGLGRWEQRLLLGGGACAWWRAHELCGPAVSCAEMPEAPPPPQQQEEEEVDILTPEADAAEDPRDSPGGAGAAAAEPPLLHLPVLLRRDPELAAAEGQANGTAAH